MSNPSQSDTRKPLRVSASLNQGLRRLLEEDPRVLVVGEDILDPYGGAFKITKGLSTAFPDRVITTPISEAGIVGLGAGLALRGYKPVVEIMFGDFVTLAADQLINQVTKMTWMYNEPLPLHLVVRAPMGGRRGYGPTHSQSLEALFMGVPGLLVVAVSNVCDPGALLHSAAAEAGTPVLFVENKLLYAQPVLTDDVLLERHGLTRHTTGGAFPTITLAPEAEPDVTLIGYGGMLPLLLEAAARLLAEEELVCELVLPHQLSPLDLDPLAVSARRTRRVVVAEEGIGAWGWGSEVVAQLGAFALEAPPARVGAALTPIPASRALEDRALPQVQDIVDAAISTVDRDFE